MTTRERRDAIKALISYSDAQIAEKLQAPGRGSITGMKNRMRADGELPPADPVRAAATRGISISASRTKNIRGGTVSKTRLQPGNIARKAESRKHDPVVTITSAAAWDPIPGVEPVALVDIPAAGRCRWPVEPDDDRQGHFMCGAECDPTETYCRSYAALSRSAYQPQNRKAA